METKRLIIRRGCISDVFDVMKFRNSAFVLKYNAMDIFNHNQLARELELSWVMELKDTHQVIGVLDASEDSLRYRVKSKSISYYMNEDFTQQGYMSEALIAFIRMLFQNGCELISARVLKGNVASERLLKKLHFVHEGTLRYAVKGFQDIIYNDSLFSITQTEFNNYY